MSEAEAVETSFEPTESADLTSAAVIDANRARKLLDRALQLSQRGDVPAAILACRQAVALDHDCFDGHVMLGQLLERQHDHKGAIAALEHALELSPDSVLERETLTRLQAQHGGNGTGTSTFQFDQEDLSPMAQNEAVVPVEDTEVEEFSNIGVRLPPTSQELAALAAAQVNNSASDAPSSEKIASASDVGFAGIAASAIAAVQARAEEAKTEAPAEPVVAPAVVVAALISSDAALPQEPATAASAIVAPVVDEPAPAPDFDKLIVEPAIAAPIVAKPDAQRQIHPTPVVPVTLRPATQRPTTLRADTTPKTTIPANFQFPNASPAPMPIWAQMLRGSSFFGRTLPLVGIAALSLGFLSWARGRAASLENAQPGIVIDQTPLTNNPAPTPNPNFAVVPDRSNAANPARNPNAQTGFTITNRTPQPQPRTTVVTNPAPVASVPIPARPAINPANPRTGVRPNVRVAARPVAPNRPTNERATSIAPAPVPAAGSNNSNFNLAPPRIETTAPAPPRVQVLPPSTAPVANPNTGANAASSSGGAPVNPAGSSAAERGYIRITQGRVGAASAPARSENRNREDERTAATAARAGRTDRAIEGFTTAINRNSPNAGYLYQQRATAFLQRGDNARAAEDFQSAITSYQDQLNRNDNANDARAGIRAARSGLNVALAGR